MVDEGTTHIVDFVHEIGVKRERTTMVMDPVDAIIKRLAMTLAGKHVHLMLSPLQGRRQFRHMNPNAADWYGMKRFPRKKSDSHEPILGCLLRLNQPAKSVLTGFPFRLDR
jgi:hypothetical protein